MARYVTIVTFLSLSACGLGINPDNPFLNIRKLYPNNPFLQNFTKGSSIATTTRTPESTPGSAAAETCGLAVTANHLIIGGQATRKGEWPWIVAIFDDEDDEEKFICGGSIINKRHIISAAHCFLNRKSHHLVAYLGIFHLDQKDSTNTQRKKVADIFINPEYDIKSVHNDIAVLLLKSPAQYTHYVKPICLWHSAVELKLVEGKLGTIIGWGRNELQREPLNEPQRIDLPIVSQEECLRSNPQFERVTSTKTFCAGFRNDTGPCNGDSGSGFILRLKKNNQSRWYLRGITSLSLKNKENSCDLREFVVFTDVAKYRTWLQNFIKEEEE